MDWLMPAILVLATIVQFWVGRDIYAAAWAAARHRHADGEPVTDLALSHQMWMHLIATRSDLGTFGHLHPEPTGRPGELAVTMVSSPPGAT